MLSDTVKSRLAERFAADTCPNSINAASSFGTTMTAGLPMRSMNWLFPA
ncbi:MAG: hypothetical protein LBP22_07220 [Deltaproteobacteria bacterium]|jgi:hypothetical protein|nr:hypothetical protein [Deltaproteobacteria bacterium]